MMQQLLIARLVLNWVAENKRCGGWSAGSRLFLASGRCCSVATAVETRDRITRVATVHTLFP